MLERIEKVLEWMNIGATPLISKLVNDDLDRLTLFLKYVPISETVLFQLDAQKDDELTSHIFRYGLLSPDGEFINLPFGKKDESAREKSWITFQAGIPYNDKGECLFDRETHMDTLNSIQKKWITEWLASFVEKGVRRPLFF